MTLEYGQYPLWLFLIWGAKDAKVLVPFYISMRIRLAFFIVLEYFVYFLVQILIFYPQFSTPAFKLDFIISHIWIAEPYRIEASS